MNDKDTVIKNEDIMDLDIPCETCEDKPDWEFPTRKCMECIALKHREVQAEISFKAGRESVLSNLPMEMEETWAKVGRREVVEWLETNRKDIPFLFDYPDWQAKLKEWGII